MNPSTALRPQGIAFLGTSEPRRSSEKPDDSEFVATGVGIVGSGISGIMGDWDI